MRNARIVAPLSSLDELGPLADAGVDEVYCGVLPPSWAAAYGESDTLTRRQGTVANIASVDELLKVARAARRRGIAAALTLNVRYTREQRAEVLAIAEEWAGAGGDAIVVSDLPLLLALNDRAVPGARHLSLLADAANHRAIAFYRRLGVSRVVFPRWLSIESMRSAAAHDPDCEYSAIVLNDRCEFIDGLCGFYHGTAYPEGTATRFHYTARFEIHCHDPAYAGHGCQLPYCTAGGDTTAPQLRDDVQHPACAACALPSLLDAGVRYLKISGRGLPTPLKLRAVGFIRAALHASGDLHGLYCQTFGSPCHDGTACYYA